METVSGAEVASESAFSKEDQVTGSGRVLQSSVTSSWQVSVNAVVTESAAGDGATRAVATATSSMTRAPCQPLRG